MPLHVTEEPAVAAASRNAFNPASLTTDDIRAYVTKAIDGESWRKYKINEPPTDRPVRIYADGLSDAFFLHSLPLRFVTCQAYMISFILGEIYYDYSEKDICSIMHINRHALQLRQAKLAFPNVYLLVGVCSDELVEEHKSHSIMNHAERFVIIIVDSETH